MDEEQPDVIARDVPEPNEARRQLCAEMQAEVTADKEFHKRAFDRMREDMRFAYGLQWPDQTDTDERYVANIVLRHTQQRVAAIYGKNPKAIARRKKRLLSTVWDGTFDALQQAMQSLMVNPMDMQAAMLLADAQQVQGQNAMFDKVAKTLELLFDHNISEQAVDFKLMMKSTVRRAVTAGVGYVKLGYQRAMQMRPEVEARIADYSERLAAVERLSADLADGETQPDSAEAERLRLAIEALRQEEMILVREGLVFDYPDSTAIIPDRQCKQLKGFLGCDRVTQEYYLTGDKIKEIFKVDVAKSARAYAKDTKGNTTVADQAVAIMANGERKSPAESGLYCVWETYSRSDGLVYFMCEGHPDFLIEPERPSVSTDRFYPWYSLTFNDVYCEHSIYPPSDVRLIRDMQLEINRARQGLREHRHANRPKVVSASGMLSDEDKEKLKTHPANALIELEAMQPGQRVEDLIQPFRQPGIDPNLYDTTPAFEDVLRTVGVQEANLGGVAGATATESSIAESSRMSSLSSAIDDMDELLTEMARNAGQILLMEVDRQTVIEVVGPGAVWPDLDRETIAREIYLEIEAASTGRPNKAAEVQNATQIMPILLQVPGISPEWIARELIRRMDDRLDLTDAFAAGAPSIQAMNAMMARMMMGAPGSPGGGSGTDSDPAAQGPEGVSNAPGTAPPQNNAAARPSAAVQPNPVFG